LDFPEGKPKILSYAAKWESGSFDDLNTKRVFQHGTADTALLDEMEAIARRCWDLFGLNGWASLDFRVDEKRRPFVLEVNANPCLSPDSGFVAAAEHAGLAYDEIISTILRFPSNSR
jgi:D-alanine-D-alanine ligase